MKRRTHAKASKSAASMEPAAILQAATELARTKPRIRKPGAVEQPSAAAVNADAVSCRSCANEVLTRQKEANESGTTIACIRCGDLWNPPVTVIPS